MICARRGRRRREPAADGLVRHRAARPGRPARALGLALQVRGAAGAAVHRPAGGGRCTGEGREGRSRAAGRRDGESRCAGAARSARRCARGHSRPEDPDDAGRLARRVREASARATTLPFASMRSCWPWSSAIRRRWPIFAESRSTAPAAPSERVAALEALIDKRVPDLAPTLFDQLADKATRRAGAPRAGGVSPCGYAAPHSRGLCRADERGESGRDRHAGVAQGLRPGPAGCRGEEARCPRRDISAFAARQMFALADATVTERLRAVWGEVRETAAARQKQLARFKADFAHSTEERRPAQRPAGLQQDVPAMPQALWRGWNDRPGPDRLQSKRSRLPAGEHHRPQRRSGSRFPHVGGADQGRASDHRHHHRTHAGAGHDSDRQRRRSILAPDDVASVKDSPLSIMPEGQLDSLTREQVRDLMSYLMSKAQVPLLVEPKK